MTISLLFGAITWGSYFDDSSAVGKGILKRGMDRLLWSFYLFCWGTAPIIEVGIIYAMAPIKNLVIRKKKRSMSSSKVDKEMHHVEHMIVYIMMLMVVGAVVLQIVGAFMSVLAVGVLFPWGPLKSTIIYLLVTVAVTFVLPLIAAYYAVGQNVTTFQGLKFSLFYGQ